MLVESGSRSLVENLLPLLYTRHPEMRADVVTCYAGSPAAFQEDRGTVYSIHDYPGPDGRRRLIGELARGGYGVLGIVCSAEPILFKWKVAIAARVPAKTFVLNENGDSFWLDRGHWSAICGFVAFRADLTGAGAVRTLARLAAFPFTLLYLLLYAATVHLRRKLRTL